MSRFGLGLKSTSKTLGFRVEVGEFEFGVEVEGLRASGRETRCRAQIGRGSEPSMAGCQGVRVSGCQGVRVSGCQGVGLGAVSDEVQGLPVGVEGQRARR